MFFFIFGVKWYNRHGVNLLGHGWCSLLLYQVLRFYAFFIFWNIQFSRNNTKNKNRADGYGCNGRAISLSPVFCCSLAVLLAYSVSCDLLAVLLVCIVPFCLINLRCALLRFTWDSRFASAKRLWGCLFYAIIPRINGICTFSPTVAKFFLRTASFASFLSI